MSAVVAGLAVDIGATIGMIFGLAVLLTIVRIQSGMSPEEAGAAVAVVIQSMGLLTTGIGLLGTFLGGRVAAKLGSHEPMRHALVFGAIVVVLSLALLDSSDSRQADWAGFVLTLPAAALGGKLVRQPD